MSSYFAESQIAKSQLAESQFAESHFAASQIDESWKSTFYMSKCSCRPIVEKIRLYSVSSIAFSLHWPRTRSRTLLPRSWPRSRYLVPWSHLQQWAAVLGVGNSVDLNIRFTNLSASHANAISREISTLLQQWSTPGGNCCAFCFTPSSEL